MPFLSVDLPAWAVRQETECQIIDRLHRAYVAQHGQNPPPDVVAQWNAEVKNILAARANAAVTPSLVGGRQMYQVTTRSGETVYLTGVTGGGAPVPGAVVLDWDTVLNDIPALVKFRLPADTKVLDLRDYSTIKKLEDAPFLSDHRAEGTVTPGLRRGTSTSWQTQTRDQSGRWANIEEADSWRNSGVNPPLRVESVPGFQEAVESQTATPAAVLGESLHMPPVVVVPDTSAAEFAETIRDLSALCGMIAKAQAVTRQHGM